VIGCAAHVATGASVDVVMWLGHMLQSLLSALMVGEIWESEVLGAGGIAPMSCEAHAVFSAARYQVRSTGDERPLRSENALQHVGGHALPGWIVYGCNLFAKYFH